MGRADPRQIWGDARRQDGGSRNGCAKGMAALAAGARPRPGDPQAARVPQGGLVKA